ncbi:glycine betaine ABC transporter substrate-binding protein [Caballeronia sp. LZ034LL]|uniref:glycine betaine ABC transporter substrate-binding protein n=1 Tax=Caballeronia sp. LZ034LL TaxID=3038567 RepID=UPI00286CAD24|nr:glycine betaine ABC transporter substrate-binding protein [Caballeronia sp. LZ034LL]
MEHQHENPPNPLHGAHGPLNRGRRALMIAAATHDTALAQRQRFIFPAWTPQYLNNGGRLRPLDDPLHVLGGENRGSLVAPQARLQMLPARTVRVLSRIRLGIDGVTQMDWLVNVQKKTPLEAARTWMQANDALVSSWFAA